jgi:hypothetical protein
MTNTRLFGRMDDALETRSSLDWPPRETRPGKHGALNRRPPIAYASRERSLYQGPDR